MEINKAIGSNIRSIRKLRGISADELADRVMQLAGYPISAGTIRRYERGDRLVSGEEIVLLAIALDCSVQAILDGVDPRMGTVKKTGRMVGRLSPEDHRILRSLATDWDGDVHALIIAGGVYAAFPPERRREAIMGLMSHMDEAIRAGEISVEDLPQGLLYLQQEIGSLFE